MRTRIITDGVRRLEVSEMCLGTMHFGTRIDEPTSMKILDRFLEAGGTFLDTANAYSFWARDSAGGESEEVIGRWLRSRGAHDRVVLGTKVGANIRDPRHSYGPSNREGLSRTAITKGLTSSLKRLGVDRIDLYYAHIDDRSTFLEETLHAFGELVSKGDVRMVAASNYSVWRLAIARSTAAQLGLPIFAAIQLRHTYLDPTPMRRPLTEADTLPTTAELLDYARYEANLTVVGYSPLLSGAYSREDRRLPLEYERPRGDRASPLGCGRSSFHQRL